MLKDERHCSNSTGGFLLLPQKCNKCNYGCAAFFTLGTITATTGNWTESKNSLFWLVKSVIKQILIGQRRARSINYRSARANWRATNGNAYCHLVKKNIIGKLLRWIA
jgi:hypothetical protein